MKETVLITGASGAIARVLSKRLQPQYSIRFLTRKKEAENEFEWDLEHHIVDEKAFDNVSHIIHLAGANISEKRWSQDRKKELIYSRTETAQLILDTLKKTNTRLKTFISASGINFYGTKTTETVFTENDPSGNDFLSEIAVAWEKAADAFKEQNIADRVVKIRTAVVLSKHDGALPKLMTPIRFGVGSPLGNGKQYMPWIHVEDLCAIYELALQNPEMEGAFNAAAPQHITNAQLTREIAELMKKPLFLPNIPAFVLKLIFGELADALLEGSRASSDKLQKMGFRFQFPNLKMALEDLLKK